MTENHKTEKDENYNRSTEKALAILELLATSDGALRLMDIAATLQLNQSTALRYLSSLIHSGYVEQEMETQRYRMTYKICRMARKFEETRSFSQISHPYLLRLTHDVGESSCISVPQNGCMVYVDVVTDQSKMLMSVQHVGRMVPMHCTGNGKLLLTTFTNQQLAQYASETDLRRYTPFTITEIDVLKNELKHIQECGYAIDNQECEQGTRCIALPIRDYTGNIIAGLSVTGPLERMPDSRLQEILPVVRSYAIQISSDLGYCF